MTAYWICLLIASLVVGIALVGAITLPRHAIPLAGMGAIAGTICTILSLNTLAAMYATTESLVVTVLFCIAGVSAGYMITAAALPHLAPTPSNPVIEFSADASGDSIVILALAEPERYSPRAVVTLQNVLSQHPDGGFPSAALPLVFMAVRSRYQATGGTSPAAPLIRSLTLKVTEIVTGRYSRIPVITAWSHTPDNLAHTVAHLATDGSSRVAIVTLGSPDIGTAALARTVLDQTLDRTQASHIRFGPSLWGCPGLAQHLAQRILAASQSIPLDTVGVVLTGLGAPEDESAHSKDALYVEYCFDQKVKVLLCEAGLSENHIRQAWLNWQSPDVTETVRHLAALGCKRILVTPSTVPMPTIETAVDLEAAVTLARVPDTVHVMTLTPWGDTDALVQAVAWSAFKALDLPDIIEYGG